MGGVALEWWGAGSIVGAHLGRDYAFLATAVGTIRHHGVDEPPPDTVEGLLYALPRQRCLVDAATLAEATPAPACRPGTATPRWTRRTWPASTGSCSSRTREEGPDQFGIRPSRLDRHDGVVEAASAWRWSVSAP